MKKYSEFTKLSIHNHFGSKDSEKKINESFNKITSMEYNSVIERLEDADKNDYELLVLTNANTFKVIDYISIRLLAKEYNIEILPGVEINVSNSDYTKFLHVVLILNPNSDLLDFQEELQECYNENLKNYITIEQLVKIVLERKVIIIPHGIKQSGGRRSSSENAEQFKEIIAFDDAIPVVIEDNKSYHRETLIQKLKDELSKDELAWLEQSANISAADRMSYSKIESPSYIWGESSFNDLFFASLMKGSRIKREEDIIVKTSYISKIEIVPKEGINNPQISYSSIECSHGLNSIIGKSGSGKTLLLNAIKQYLTGENLETKSSGISEYNEIYKDVDIYLYDSNENKISLEDKWKVFEGDNLYNKILKAYSSDKTKLLDELDLEVNSNVFDSIITSFSNKLTDYKDNLLRLIKLRKGLSETIASLSSNIDFLNENKKVSSESITYLKDTNLVTKMNDLIEKLKVCQTDIETMIKIKNKLIEYSNKYNADCTEDISKLYTKIIEKIDENKLDILKVELNLKEQIEIQSSIYNIVKRYNLSLGKKLEAIIEKKQEILTFIENIKDYLKQIIPLQEQIEVPCLNNEMFKTSIKLNPNTYSKLLINDINLSIDYSNLTNIFDSCIGQSNNKINLTKFKNVNLNLCDSTSIEKFIDIFVKDDYKYDISLNKDYNSYLNYEIQLKNSSGNYENIETLSAGELGKTYISNMIDKQISNGGSNLIILFDQPDSNLEKKFILNELVTKINNLRNNFQVFITTHEPLLVVNADSNNIIKAENNKSAISKKNAINYERLSFVDSTNSKNDMIEKIAEMVDGSHKAVKERDKIYGGMLNEN